MLLQATTLFFLHQCLHLYLRMFQLNIFTEMLTKITFVTNTTCFQGTRTWYTLYILNTLHTPTQTQIYYYSPSSFIITHNQILIPSLQQVINKTQEITLSGVTCFIFSRSPSLTTTNHYSLSILIISNVNSALMIIWFIIYFQSPFNLWVFISVNFHQTSHCIFSPPTSSPTHHLFLTGLEIYCDLLDNK